MYTVTLFTAIVSFIFGMFDNPNTTWMDVDALEARFANGYCSRVGGKG